MIEKREIGIDDLRFQVPSDWNSMSIGQLRFLAELLEVQRTSFEVCVMMLLYTIGANADFPEYSDGVTVIKIGSRRFPLTTDQVSDLAMTYEFLFDNCFGRNPHITSHLTNNPFPQIDCGSDSHLFGADYSMLSIPFGRYVWLQTYLSGVQHDKDNFPKALACVWCHDPALIEPSEDDVDIIRKLPAWQQLVMFWFICGSLENIQDKFPRVFSSGGTAAAVGNVLDLQLRLLDSLAGGDMTKKEQVRSGKLIDALYVIDESIRKKEEYDKEVERMKQKHK